MTIALKRFERLRRDVVKLARGLSVLEELADRIENDIAMMTGKQIESMMHPSVGKRQALSLKSLSLPDGACIVTIDHGDEIRLSPRLWCLLRILVERSPGAEDARDEGIGWKRLDDVRAQMSKILGQRITKGYLATLVWRLRDTLGRDGDLIQIDKARGLIRFAMRHPTPSPVVITV